MLVNRKYARLALHLDRDDDGAPAVTRHKHEPGRNMIAACGKYRDWP